MFSFFHLFFYLVLCIPPKVFSQSFFDLYLLQVGKCFPFSTYFSFFYSCLDICLPTSEPYHIADFLVDTKHTSCLTCHNGKDILWLTMCTARSPLLESFDFRLAIILNTVSKIIANLHFITILLYIEINFGFDVNGIPGHPAFRFCWQ